MEAGRNCKTIFEKNLVRENENVDGINLRSIYDAIFAHFSIQPASESPNIKSSVSHCQTSQILPNDYSQDQLCNSLNDSRHFENSISCGIKGIKISKTHDNRLPYFKTPVLSLPQQMKQLAIEANRQASKQHLM